MNDNQSGNTGTDISNICRVCGREIKVQIRRGSRICSGDCEDIAKFQTRRTELM